jgi:hypothetical protein
MCVIIDRQPGAVIDFDLIKSACIVNPHGFGLVVPDRGKAELVRVYNEKGNDPEEVAKWLEDTKDHHVLLHLRFQTKGTKNLENCHPFDIFGTDRTDYQLFLAHNGTISGYGGYTDAMSDTYQFGQEFVRPLWDLMLKGHTPEEIMGDPFVKKLLEKESGSGSKLLLVDNLGNFLKTSDKDWYDFESWSASNKYSFDRGYREPTPVYKPVQSSFLPSTNVKTFEPATPSLDKSTKVSSVVPWATPSHRVTFKELLDLETLDEVCCLSEEDIDELVLSHPAYATVLILDLLVELYNRAEEEADFND